MGELLKSQLIYRPALRVIGSLADNASPKHFRTLILTRLRVKGLVAESLPSCHRVELEQISFQPPESWRFTCFAINASPPGM